MDLLDRLLGHDAWTTRALLLRCHELTPEQLDRPFEIGHGSLRKSLQHIVFNVHVWAELMSGRIVSPSDVRSAPAEIEGLIDRLDEGARTLSQVARAVAKRDGWDETWTDVLDTPPAPKTFGGAIAHVITHSMHHRAQALYMLRQLGLRDVPEGDVFSWERRSDGARTIEP